MFNIIYQLHQLKTIIFTGTTNLISNWPAKFKIEIMYTCNNNIWGQDKIIISRTLFLWPHACLLRYLQASWDVHDMK